MKRWKYSVFVLLMLAICVMAVKDQPQTKAYAKEKSNTQGYVFESDDTLIIYERNVRFTTSADQEKAKKIVHIKFEGDYLHSGNLEQFSSLERLTISKNTTRVIMEHDDGDDELKNLKEITVDSQNPFYADYEGALYTKDYRTLLYYPMKGAIEAVPAHQTVIIGNGAFDGVPIVSIKIPEKLAVIQYRGLANTKLEELSLPAAFRVIEQNAFKDSKIKNVTIAENNQSLCSVDGVVYSRDHSYLFYWPEEKISEKLVLPEGLSYFDCDMIVHFDQVQILQIPKSLTAIVNTNKNQLKEILLDKNNRCFSLYDGVLYSKDQCILRLYPNKNTDQVIELSSKLRELPLGMFECENTTTSLTIPAGLSKLAAVTSYSHSTMLSGFTHLSELKLSGKSSEYVIQDNVLYNADKTILLWYPVDIPAKKFIIPDTVTGIANDQLVKQNHLEEIVIPANCKVTDIDALTSEYQQWYEMSFGAQCIKLKAFKVSEKNPYYVSKDGVLFSKDMTIMLGYPCAKTDTSYEIPESVFHAPFGNSNPYLKTLVIGKNLKTLAIPVYYTCGEFESNGLVNYSALSEIKVSENNSTITVIGGAVYKKTEAFKTYLTLLVYPRGRKDAEFYLAKDTADMSGGKYFEKHSYLKKFYVDTTSELHGIKNGKLWLDYNDYFYLNLDGIELLSK